MSEWTTLGSRRRRRTRAKNARTPPPTVGEAPKETTITAPEKGSTKENIDVQENQVAKKIVKKNPVEAPKKSPVDEAAAAVANMMKPAVKKAAGTRTDTVWEPLPVTTFHEKSKNSNSTSTPKATAKPTKVKKPVAKPPKAVKKSKQPVVKSTDEIMFMAAKEPSTKKKPVRARSTSGRKGATITLTWTPRKVVEKSAYFEGSFKKENDASAQNGAGVGVGMNPNARPFATTPRPVLTSSKSLPGSLDPTATHFVPTLKRAGSDAWEPAKHAYAPQPMPKSGEHLRMLENGLWVAGDDEAKFQRSLMARLPPKMMGQPTQGNENSGEAAGTQLYNLVRPYHCPTTAGVVHWPLT